jgi:hypothetical protein
MLPVRSTDLFVCFSTFDSISIRMQEKQQDKQYFCIDTFVPGHNLPIRIRKLIGISNKPDVTVCWKISRKPTNP